MAPAYTSPRCETLPLPDHQFAFLIDGKERLRWHYGLQYPRPFVYPLLGPDGQSLTRMGHPGDPSHDHHRSIWFAHTHVMGTDFWREGTKNRIRQKDWLAVRDGDDETALSLRLGWFDDHDAELMEQRLILSLRPGPQAGESLLELQSTFVPTGAKLPLAKTNFGFLAVRVAKNLSAHFGGGVLRDSEGREGEPAIFGKQAAWMDYSGPVRDGKSAGITYFDHPTNPRHPTYWHVRDDGWMGASFGLAEPYEIDRESPLTLRYLLYAHFGPLDRQHTQTVWKDWSKLPLWETAEVKRKHARRVVRRVGSEDE